MATNADDDHKWLHHTLEPPKLDDHGSIDWALLWLYRRKRGVLEPRPIFTGDVFADVTVIGEDEPVTFVILQHPCALFDRNNELREVLLSARLVDFQEVSVSGWAGNYDYMPLVVSDTNPPKHQAVALNELVLVRSSELDLKKRVACMEIEGIARLLQRWTNVNTRVVVPGWRFEQVVDAQFAEAEGMETWCAERAPAGIAQVEAAKEATAWLDEKLAETGKPRRLILQDPSSRKTMIRLMLNTAKTMTQEDLAEQARLEAEREEVAATDATAAELEPKGTAVAEPEAAHESELEPTQPDSEDEHTL